MLALIDDGGVALTHEEMAARADAWAGWLAHAHGVRPGDRVAVLALGSAEVFVVMAACARIGAAFVPLSWRLGVEELREIVAHCRPKVVLCDEEMRAVGEGLDAPVAGLQIVPGPGHGHDGHGEIAQVLYTSGTTGRPKGVLITRRQVEFNAAVTAKLCGLAPTDRVLGLLPLFHTGGLHALATPALAAGGSVLVMRRFDAAKAVAHLASAAITAIIAVPTIYEQLLDAGLRRATAPHLRLLLVGGAPVTPALIARYRQVGLCLRQGYGLTEVGPNCFTFGQDGSVGRPVPGTEARLVDGELHLRGPHVTAGYLDDPEATAAVLDADGWFRTGDAMRLDGNGRYRVVGRKKEMYISGGENVYPAEVERVVAAHPAVAEAAVVGVPDPRWGEVGLAAVVARGALTTADLERWTRARLAGYKVPRHWHFVDALPRTPSGKVRRADLLHVYTARRRGRRPYQAPAAPGAGRAQAPRPRRRGSRRRRRERTGRE